MELGGGEVGLGGVGMVWDVGDEGARGGGVGEEGLLGDLAVVEGVGGQRAFAHRGCSMIFYY